MRTSGYSRTDCRSNSQKCCSEYNNCCLKIYPSDCSAYIRSVRHRTVVFSKSHFSLRLCSLVVNIVLIRLCSLISLIIRIYFRLSVLIQVILLCRFCTLGRIIRILFSAAGTESVVILQKLSAFFAIHLYFSPPIFFKKIPVFYHNIKRRESQ